MQFKLNFIFTFIFTQLFTTNIYSQKKLESLTTKLLKPGISNSDKIPILNKLIWRWNLVNKDSSNYYLDQYRELVNLEGSFRQKSDLAHYESLRLLDEGKFMESIVFAKKRIEIAVNNNIKNKEFVFTDGFSDIGLIYLKMNNLDSALYYFEKGIEYGNLVQDSLLPLKNSEVRNKINICEVLKLKGDYLKAIEIAQNALVICLKHKTYGFKASLYNLLGDLYFEIKDFEKAKENYLQAINSSIKNYNINRLSVSYENMAKYEIEMKNYNLAIDYLNKSYEIGNNSKNNSIIGRVLWKIAKVYSIENKNDLAIEKINKSIQALSSKYDHLELENALKVKGVIFNSLKEYSKSIDICSIALNSNKLAKNKTNEMEIYKCLYDSYKNLNDSKNALIYLEKYNHLKDSLLNFTVSRKITQLEFQTKYDTKILTDSLMNFNKISDLNLQHQKENTISLLIIISSFLGGIFSLYLYLVHKKNANNLKVKNQLIENQKNEINNALNQKEILLKEIHHRVKNNLQIILSLLELQSNLDSKTLDVLKESQSRVKTMSLIHQKLYQTDNLAVIDMNEYILELCQYLNSIFLDKNMVDFTLSTSNIKLDIDTAIPLGLILNELISNSLKYAFKDIISPEIKIILIEKQRGKYELICSDNGIGFDTKEVKNFTSLGLKLVKRLTDQLFGELKIENENGMKFTIDFLSTELRKEID